jgi:hypothetical protein
VNNLEEKCIHRKEKGQKPEDTEGRHKIAGNLMKYNISLCTLWLIFYNTDKIKRIGYGKASI